jgi:hypothetical protein
MNKTIEEIKNTIEALAKLEAVKRHDEMLRSSIVTMQQQLAEKTNQLSEEQDDIETLEKLNISSIFHKIMGNKEEKLEQERQEYLALAMKIKELKKSIELNEYELNIIQQKVLDSETQKQRLIELKAIRQEEILTHNEEDKGVLSSLLQEGDELIKFNAEIREANDAGINTSNHCRNTLNFLAEAIKSGQLDMAGVDMMSYSKHQSLDRATEAAYYTQQYLKTYTKELLDIGISDRLLHLNVDSFSNFSDVFFDNLITDWIIQNKIKNTYNSVELVYDKIQLIQQSLQAAVEKNNSRLLEIESLKSNILLKV